MKVQIKDTVEEQENSEVSLRRGEPLTCAYIDEFAFFDEPKSRKVGSFKFKREGNISGRKFKKRTIPLLYKEAYIKNYIDKYGTHFGDCWFSKETDEYLIPVGMENDLAFLISNGIDSHLGHGLGFSTKSQKWFGWSHRAIRGFGIGSTVIPGDCAFNPSSKEEFEQNYIAFWGKDERNEDGGFTTKTLDIQRDILGSHYEETPKEKLVPGITIITETTFHGSQAGRKSYITKHWDAYPETYGKGAWTATSLEEAKQMAIDFKNGVS